MEKIRLGRTGMIVSRLGFGGIPIQRDTEEEAVAVVKRCLDLGINYIDTANGYSTSEERIGKAVAGRRNKVYIATKTGGRTREEVEKHLALSLQRLQTDYIDLYQFHQIAQEKDWQDVTSASGALEAVMKARSAGKVRHIGVTSHNLQMALKMVRSGLFDTIQFPFNLIEEGAKDELIGAAHEAGMGFIHGNNSKGANQARRWRIDRQFFLLSKNNSTDNDN